MKNSTKSFFKLALALIIVFSALETLAINIVDTTENYDISEAVNLYNENIDKIPKIFIKIFGNERINFYLDNELIYGFRTENAKIVETIDGGITNPTINVYVTQEGLNKIISNEITPQEALKQGQIDYKGVGFFKKIKYGTLKISSRWLL